MLVFLPGPALRNFSEVVATHIQPRLGLFNGRFSRGSLRGRSWYGVTALRWIDKLIQHFCLFTPRNSAIYSTYIREKLSACRRKGPSGRTTAESGTNP